MPITLDGTTGSTQAAVAMTGATSGTVTLTPPAVAGTQNYTLPTAQPTANGQALTATTAGVMSWATASASPGGSTTQVQYNNAGSLAGISGFTTDGTRVTASTTIGVGGATPSTSGSGITFPSGESLSTNPNTLDDYEEGTWTAAITCGTSGTITLDPSYNTLKYTKVGKLVTLTGFIYVSAVSSPVGTVTITGLPFTNGSANGNNAGVSAYVYGLNTASNLMLGIDKSASSINTRTFSAGAVTTSIAGYFVATSGVYVNLSYFFD